MTRYQHVIWDWNGTLLDDVELCLDVINGMLRARSMNEIDVDRYRDIFDFPVIGYYRALGFDFSAEPFDDLAHEYCDSYDRRVPECRLHAGVDVLLERMAGAVPRQSILSSSEQIALDAAVAGFGLIACFDTVAGLADRRAAGKVAAGRELIATADVALSKTVLVGDTLHDHEVAQALGIDCLLVANGHQSRRRLETAGHPVFESLDEAVRFLD